MTCARCNAYEAQVTTMRIDLQNLQADVIGKNRQIEALRRELSKMREDEPEGKDIRRILEHWRVKTNHPRAQIPLTGERAKRVRARLKDGFTSEQLHWAINGAAAFPFVGPRGRMKFGEEKQRHDDLVLICQDEATVDRFIGYYRRHLHEPIEWPAYESPTDMMVRLARYVICPSCGVWRHLEQGVLGLEAA